MGRDTQTLTPAEREALKLVGEGHISKEIARVLGISVSAVNQRVDSARQKLGGVTRLQAARRLRSEACDPITGDPITVAGKTETIPWPSPQQIELRVEEPKVAFQHEALAPSEITEPANDLTTFRILRSAILFAALIFGLLLVAITVMRTVNDLGRPILDLIK